MSCVREGDLARVCTKNLAGSSAPLGVLGPLPKKFVSSLLRVVRYNDAYDVALVTVLDLSHYTLAEVMMEAPTKTQTCYRVRGRNLKVVRG